MHADRNEKVNWTRRILGCTLAFLSTILYALQGSTFQLVYEVTTVFWLEALWFSEIALFLLALAIVAFRRDSVCRDKEDMKWLVALSVVSCVDWPVRYYAVILIPFADVFALSLSGGMVLQLVLGKLFLKETCDVLRTVTCLVVLAGMALLTDPGNRIEPKLNKTEKYYPRLLNETYDSSSNFSQLHSKGEEEWDFPIGRRTLGILLSIVDCLLNTIVNMFLRKLEHVHIGVVLLYIVTLTMFGTAGLILCIHGQFSLPQSGDDWTYVSLFVFVSVLFNSSEFGAYLYEESGTVSTIRTVEIAFSYLFQFLILGLVPSLLVALGATTVSIATFAFGFVICVRNSRNKNNGEKANLL